MDNKGFNCEILHSEYEELNTKCDFCGHLLKGVEEVGCCESTNLVRSDGRDLCTNCGTMDRYHFVSPKTSFYDRMHFLRGTSSYKLKHYVGKMILKSKKTLHGIS